GKRAARVRPGEPATARRVGRGEWRRGNFAAMTSPPVNGSLLESLRTQADALRVQGEAARKPAEEAIRDMDRRLWQAFRWLDEALGHLDVIQPQVEHRFRLGNLLEIERPKFEHGFVSFRRRPLAGFEVLDHVAMYYRLAGGAPIVLRGRASVSSTIDEKLRSSSLPFHHDTEFDESGTSRNAVYTVTPAIAASVRFEPDYSRQLIHVVSTNVDRFESVKQDFPPAAIGEAALEDLVRFVLGESDAFLRRAPLAGIKARRG
ncbi:MAG: hypothetical protein ACXWHZ_18430, partial [Usitatibacter sp.]